MRRRQFLIYALVAFGLLSVADFALTRHLLHGSGGAYEANPTARWVLERHGWNGLAVFKLAATLFAATLTALVYYYRPKAGARLMAFGCAVLTLVVAYSGALLLTRHAAGGTDGEMIWEDREAARLARAKEQCDKYSVVVKQVSERLAHGELTLAHAVEHLAATEQASDPKWLRPLHTLYPGLSDHGCLAATVVQYTVESLDWPTPTAKRTSRRLLTELYALCGTNSPESFERILQRLEVREAAPSGPVAKPGGALPRPDLAGNHSVAD